MHVWKKRGVAIVFETSEKEGRNKRAGEDAWRSY